MYTHTHVYIYIYIYTYIFLSLSPSISFSLHLSPSLSLCRSISLFYIIHIYNARCLLCIIHMSCASYICMSASYICIMHGIHIRYRRLPMNRNDEQRGGGLYKCIHKHIYTHILVHIYIYVLSIYVQ